ncbi:MAG TPA: hypothetical protein VKZ18_01665 [Polyangia bacterium]|nr:hypothetical protein [Polyangia bacterium]
MRHPGWRFIALALMMAPPGCNLDRGTLGTQTGSGGGPSTGAGGTIGCGALSGGTCGVTSVSIAPPPPDILIVQSEALSMANGWDNQPCPGGCGASSKWAGAAHAVESIVGTSATFINWGLEFYGGASACGTTSVPYVPVGEMNAVAIGQAFSANQPAGANPLETAVNGAAAFMSALTDSNPKYLLLVTDGLPDCVPGDVDTTVDDSQGAEAAVASARMQGFPAFVVGLAPSDANVAATFTQLALDGGEAQSGGATAYYQVTDEGSLEAALMAIAGAVSTCTIPLTDVPAGLTNVAVAATDASGQAVEIPQDASDGWSYTDANMDTIILNGAACTNLRTGTYTNYKFLYSCAGVNICIR